nr:uncharacterized protein LOC109192287 [Ipomoea batatas]
MLLLTQPKDMGFGWSLRDEHGQFVAASGIPSKGVFTPKEAEAMAIKETLSWIKNKNMDHVEVESDALQVIQSLNQVEGVSSFDLVLLDVNDIPRSCAYVVISRVNRTANRVAHALIREACSMSVRQLCGLYTKHHYTRMVVPVAVGCYPETVACVECWQTMEKFFMYIHAQHLRHHPRPRLPPTAPILGSASSSVTGEEKSQSSLLRYSRSCSNSRANGCQLYCFSMRGLSFEGTSMKLCL